MFDREVHQSYLLDSSALVSPLIRNHVGFTTSMLHLADEMMGGGINGPLLEITHKSSCFYPKSLGDFCDPVSEDKIRSSPCLPD